jgi:hypothetical protein
MNLEPYGLADRIITRLSLAFFWYFLMTIILINIIYYGLFDEISYSEEKTKDSKFRA